MKKRKQKQEDEIERKELLLMTAAGLATTVLRDDWDHARLLAKSVLQQIMNGDDE